MKYYFLISYLPEIHRDDKKLRFRVFDLLAEKVYFSEEDWAQIELVLLANDVLQVERLLSGKEVATDYQQFGREFWKEQIKSHKEVPEYFAEVFDLLLLEGVSPKNLNFLYEAYYHHAIENASSPLLRKYLNFEKDLRNIITAIRARRKGFSPASYLVGEGEIVELLSRSTAEDFGLGPEYPWVERLNAAKEPVDMEETIEQIIWETLDEMTEQMDFNFDVILAYLLKLQRLERNLALSEEQGMEIVKQMEEL
jgi:vacuolar-type H+-ATPase subunit C/Vma6